MKKLVLIDGHALIHRAFHAIPELMTKNGQLVNAVYGFSLILLNSLKELEPEYVAVAFDLAKPTFRHKKSKAYKAKRKKTDQKLAKQIPYIKKVVQAMNIPIYEAQGYEADDVIGTLAKKMSKQYPNLKVVIVTGDLDLLQLVDENIEVYTMRRGLTDMMIYTPKAVKKRYGFPAEHLVDYKGLVGDTSDNISGVTGVGKKSATKLIRKYENLETIFQALEKDELDAQTRTITALKKGQKQAFDSRDLGLIRTNVLVKTKLSEMELANYDQKKIVELFAELEFKSLINKLPATIKQKDLFGETNERQKQKKDYQLIANKKQLKQLKDQITKQGLSVIDLETKDLGGDPVGMSFAFNKTKAYYLPFNKQFKLADVKDILENDKIKKIGHGIKYDYRVLANSQVELQGIEFDTLLAAHLLDPEKRNYKLDRLAFSELGREMIPIEDLMGKDYKITLDKVAVEKLKNYSCEDAEITWLLYQKYLPELKKRKLIKAFRKIELPLIVVLAKMEQKGIKIDQPYLEKIKDKVTTDLKVCKDQIYKLAGEEFNIRSTQQLGKILFEKLDIPSRGVRRTKTGISTAASELEKIRSRHIIVEQLLMYRQLEKMRNTYIEPLLEHADKKSRINTNFNQAVTATGRLSSSEPNLQNIPARTELGQEVKASFIAGKDYLLLSCDYSQIELRVAAHLSGDETMIKTFERGEDIHTSTAAKLNEVKLDQVTPTQRREAKTVNFGVLYGMSPYGLAQALNQPPEYAAEFINNYFIHFSGVRKYLDKIKDRVAKNGYVQTMFGRKRYFNFQTGNMPVQQMQRAAINTPIQGTAADIIKLAMIEINEQMPDARLLLQVHDELVFEVKKSEMQKTAAKVKQIMEQVVKLKVPIEVDVKIGKRWGQGKELE